MERGCHILTQTVTRRLAFSAILLLMPFLSFAQNWVLNGKVADLTFGTPIPNASVISRASKANAISDSTGNFTITLKAGEQLITISSVGYFPKNLNITYKEILAGVDVKLAPETRELKELIVKEKAPDENVRSSQMSVARLDIKNLKNIPVVFGEVDIIKALTLQPGVSTVGEGTSGFNVRGGRTDQNLVLLDGAPLFNTSHLLGFLSNVNADAIRDVTLYKGDIPAAYGGRLSSLLEINTRSGNKERVNVAAGVGLMTAGITADGPLTKNKRLTFLAGGRVAYPNLLIKRFPEPTNQNKAFFFDLNARLSYEISENSVLSATGYYSHDSFKFPEDTLYGWKSTAATLNWNKQINKSLSFQAGANLSYYTFNLEGISPTNEYLFQSGIRQYNGHLRVLWTPSLAHKLDAGLDFTHYQLAPGNLSPRKQSNITDIDLEKEQAIEQAAYVSDEWSPLSWISVSAGLRYVYFKNSGPGTVYEYQNGVPRTEESIVDTLTYGKGKSISNFGGLEPRLSVRINTGKTSSLKMSYTKTRQYLHLISNTTAISPVDFWKLADDFVPPQSAEQLALGYFRNFNDNTFETSVEIYRKRLSNLVEYKNGATLLLNPALETDLVPAVGKAYGIEFSIQKSKGILTGLVSYTYSRTFARVQSGFASEQINKGDWFPATVDRPNSVSISTQWKWKRGWTFGTNFVYMTGRPITFPDGTYRLNDVVVQDYSQRNLDRVPDYHRMDVSFTKDTRVATDQRRYSLWSFSLYNLYARKNPYSIYFKQSGTRLVSYRLSVFGTIIPSINWKYHF
ncbi:carboxypeptidase-like regulatory domain-containing protein [Dyadobacter sp. CY343]|uniref:TonB-dependent receptor n=1 Tax=Dyadobacter sp. CY343 TaxID=2907299 RepID=UPI001F23A351|nr:carboxypeptidase-like regulatory domain-containing protein [Dyadobacter sp. CY343]MCE7061568.1 TonB-dependent receptor [Dyadobacter sp. CY343]